MHLDVLASFDALAPKKDQDPDLDVLKSLGQKSSGYTNENKFG
jgi:hypothetical protein